ncbi:MAG: 2OG-Fe(II) oxygenase family protein [Pseudomonadota bacterium]
MTPANIPVIDAASLGTHEGRERLDSALREWGVFRLHGHGLSAPLCADTLAVAAAFFAQPTPAKRRYERDADNPWGFFDRELTKNVQDWKEIFDIGAAHDAHAVPWPVEPAEFRGAMLEYFAAAEGVARRIVGAIADLFGVDSLDASFAGHTSFLRHNYYPPCADAAPADAPTDQLVPATGRLGIGHHTDAGAVTVLLQDDVPGLEVWQQGRWQLVPADPEALIINTGDVVQVWSNDRYPAALHRVRANSRLARRSCAFFFNPAPHVDYAPLPGACLTEPPRYRPINWAEFRGQRAAGDYADVGEEIQIGAYRI